MNGVSLETLHDAFFAIESRIDTSPDTASRSVLISTIAKRCDLPWRKAVEVFTYLVNKKALKQVPGMGPIFRTVYTRGDAWNDMFITTITAEGSYGVIAGCHRNVS